MNNETKGRCPKHGLPFDAPTECSRCSGEGVVEDDEDISSYFPEFIACWQCRGSGDGLPDCAACLMEAEEYGL